MIKYFEGTVFNVKCEAMVNTINCVGVMGAGIALEFALRYPNMYNDYIQRCKGKEVNVGRVYAYKEKDTMIINFPTKWHFKYPSPLSWIEQGLKDFANKYKEYNIKSVAFPKLGTLNGGLDWDKVRRIMEKYLQNLDIDVYICLDILQEAEGLEKQMLDYFNKNYNDVIKAVKKINSVQTQNIQERVPLKRFWQLSKIPKIGQTTYEKIYLYCKDAVENGAMNQISLFDNID